MQYKGEDLDLRVPARPTRDRDPGNDYEAAANGRWARPLWSTPHEPIWVDEIVLQCCNYAYDIAVAHAAPEVGLEHLVHALTRVDAAARILEARGVREGQLRRDSAALLASEIPTTQIGERSAPRRSPDMEDVLRRATEVAGRRGHAASVEDVLWTILNYGRDVPAVALLRRLTPDWQRPEWGRGREQPVAEPVSSWRLREAAPVAEPAPQPAARVVERVVQERVVPVLQDGVLARMSSIEDGIRAVLAEVGADRKAAAQRLATLEDGLRALHQEWASERRLNVVPRIAAIEDGVRALHAEIGGERKAVADLIRDIQRDVVAQRGDQAAFRGDLGQRLETLERSIQVRGDATRIPAQMSDRMQALEKAVHSGLGEGARNWAALGQRLQALEAAVQQRQDGGDVPAVLVQRLAGLEQALDARMRDMRLPDGLAERLAAIERMVSAGAGEGGRHWAQLSERIGNIETVLKSRAADPGVDVTALTDRVGGLERAVRSGFGENMRVAGEMRDRLAAVERAAQQPGSNAVADEAYLMLDERLGGIERVIEARLRESDQIGSEIVERVRAMETRMAGAPSGAAFDPARLTEPLAQRLAGLSSESAERSGEIMRLVRETGQKLTDLETASRAGLTQTEEALRARDREIQDMHDAIVRLAENQHTLASAIADWRHEVHADFGSVNAQIERLSAAPAPAVRTVARPAPDVARPPYVEANYRGDSGDSGARGTEARVDPLVKTERFDGTSGEGERLADALNIEPSTRSRGFWYWLFGTGQVTHANRDATMRFERLQQQLREKRERRRGEA